MHWIFFTIAAVALAFTLLGALSVMVVILALALKAMLVAAVVFALYLLWQKFIGRNHDRHL